MMKNKNLFTATLLLGAMMTACTAGKEKEENKQQSPEAEDVYAIAPDKRYALYEQGNLVPNASFEDVSGGFAAGWSKTGTDVKGQASVELCEGEKYRGKQSVKIDRPKADELDPMTGVVSDFIPVLAGNYRLSYYIRLKNVKNCRRMEGIKLYDAIAIEAHYYDKDKKRIENAHTHLREHGINIDIERKERSWTNYWQVPDFGWGYCLGVSYGYPTDEGFLPPGTRYVKLAFGLRGTGTMWLDDVDYRYTNLSFTAKERYQRFAQNDYRPHELIIPTPKEIEPGQAVEYYKDGGPLPIILIPQQAASEELTAANLLKDQLEKRLEKMTGQKQHVNIANKTDDINEGLIFSIGQTELFDNQANNFAYAKIAGHKQGYLIEQKGHVVYLIGNQPIGSYYAVTTACQLLDNEKPVYHSASVADYPDAKGRSFRYRYQPADNDFHADAELLPYMALFKLNKVYVPYGSVGAKWKNPQGFYRKGMKLIANKCRDLDVIDMFVLANPYYQFGFRRVDEIPDSTQLEYVISNPVHQQKLKDFFEISLKEGAKGIMLNSDDFVPYEGANKFNYVLHRQEDREKFTDLQTAHAWVVNDLYDWLQAKYPGTRFEFCPPWYSHYMVDGHPQTSEYYLKQLSENIPGDVPIIWTGGTIRSQFIDVPDIERFKSFIGRYPMLWDNTLYGSTVSQYGEFYPELTMACNLFEPIQIAVPDSFYKYTADGHIYSNHYYTEEMGQHIIKYLTVADWEWNQAAYDPDFSMYKALRAIYGQEISAKLLDFNDAFFRAQQQRLMMRWFGKSDEYKDKGLGYLAETEKIAREISTMEVPNYYDCYYMNDGFLNDWLQLEVDFQRRKFENALYEEPDVIEAEDLEWQNEGGGGISHYRTSEPATIKVSAQDMLTFKAGKDKERACQYCTEIDLPGSGYYTMQLRFFKVKTSGYVQVLVDGKEVSGIIDTKGLNKSLSKEGEEMLMELPVGQMEKGRQKLCLRLPNVHPNVYLAPKVHLDYIKFVKK